MTKHRPWVFSRLAALGLAILVASPTIAQDYRQAVKQGLTLTPAGAEKIETSLIADPHDLYARAQLLGYYSARAGQDQAARGERLRHIEWLVRNQPASLLLRNRSVRLQPSDFAAPYGANLETLRLAWKEQADQYPNDALVIENAWESLGGVDFGINGRGVSSAEYVSGGTSAEYLKRLRVLDPGNPEWAFDLASVYTLAVVRGAQPDATLASKRLGFIILAELEKSDDAAVIGWTGASIYQGRLKAREPVSESLLRTAAALNPKNPAWARALGGAVPASAAEFGAALTAIVQETDLWPGGVVRMMNVPPGAIRMAPADEAARRPPLTLDLTSPVVAPACGARFDALIERDGRIKNLQVVAFDHLNIPFIRAARDALRQVQYPPMLVDGQTVEIVTEIDVRCSTRPKQVAMISPDSTPPAVGRGVTVGVPDKNAADNTKVAGDANTGDALPRVLRKIEPSYTEEALRSGLMGAVRVQFVVGADGATRDIRVVRGLGLGLDENAILAVKEWQFEPGRKAGVPTDIAANSDVNFALRDTSGNLKAWHLARIEFHQAEGASRPTIETAPAPLVSGHQDRATATVTFGIDEQGAVVNLRVTSGSDQDWGRAVTAALAKWSFSPAFKDGVPLTASCIMDFVRGN